ncbi:MMPL family transporter [Cellulomonas sp. SG140]|uniref:MMPL family transporter n=1 Tax=Cellulomonas sp. SG140 TaxID=2976536 RepID=UPI0021E7C9EF|nr:MMPL family transporter [Cellulomonas sp. SG140]
MFARLGRAVARRPRTAVLVWLVLAAVAYVLAVTSVTGQTVFDRLTTGAPAVPGSESDAADAILASTAQGGASLTLAVSGADPAAPGVAEALAPQRSKLAAVPGVASVIDPLVLPGGVTNPAAMPLVARDGKGFLVVVELKPDVTGDAKTTALHDVETLLGGVPDALRPAAPQVTGVVGGTPLIVDAITGQVEKDLRTGEAIALPVALLVMVLVFGGFLAAAMPMAGALASIAGGLAAVLGLSYVMTVDASVVNVVTVLGLGLSIDYGLLVVSRYREELHRLTDTDGGAASRRRRGDGAVAEAVERTMATAGRTVTFSALTVAISIAGLLVFRPDILRAVGAAAVGVIVVALATALTLVPALLAWSGRRLARPSVLARVPLLRAVLARTSDVQSEEGSFSRLAARVQRRPWWVMGGTLALLALLASPLAHLELRNSGAELLPRGSDQVTFLRLLADQYPSAAAPAITVLVQSSMEQGTALATKLAGTSHVRSVDPPAAVGSYVQIGLRLDTTDPAGAVARGVVKDVRALRPGFPVWVTGQAAHELDFQKALAQRAWLAGGIVAVATLVLLFLMTGSVVVPLKALLTNVLSLSASLGVLVWTFQDGHLAGLLGFTSVGGIETYVLALVVAFAFGLAMDYEVFLLSRIKELYDGGVTSDDAVRLGLQRSGRIITSAAAIVIVVFSGFVAGRLLVIKEVGFALAVAVLVDATVVRVLLVPATMTVLGRWNWWAPAPLRRLHERLAITH